MNHPNLWAVICAHNEEETIEGVVRNMLEIGWPLVVVDNASSDGTSDVLAPYQRRITLLQEPRLGKAYALKSGFDYVLKSGAERVLTMDGDGEHKSDEMEKLANAHYDGGGVPITIANRFPDIKDRSPKDVIISERIGELTGSYPADPRSGGRVYDRRVLERLLPSTVAQNYGLDVELCYLALQEGLPIQFCDIDYSKARERVLVNGDGPEHGCLNGELLDLYRVFGRGDIAKGKSIVNAHDVLHGEFHNGDEYFGHDPSE